MSTVPRNQIIPLQQLAADLNGNALSTMVLVAHPDDETIAVGGRLHQWPFVHVVHMTQGAPRDPAFARCAGCSDVDTYAAIRALELDHALAVAGLSRDRSIRLGRVDQEAHNDLVQLTLEVLNLLQLLKPSLLITHPYEGGHPDHDAAAFVAQYACYLGASRGMQVPMRVEAPFYHRRCDLLRVGEFLPEAPWPSLEFPLDQQQRQRKARMVECYRSQAAILSAFQLDHERFRLAPTYDFASPPHEGTLHYESLGWRVSGPAWRAQARKALSAISMKPTSTVASQGTGPCP